MDIREAVRGDLPAIVRILADDPTRGPTERVADPLPEAYAAAFARMTAQPGNRMFVAAIEGEVVGCVQVTVVHGVASSGLTRCIVEAVGVAAAHRNRGVGAALMGHAIACARADGCGVVQLTSSAWRVDARRFYERLGFVSSHVGFKLKLAP